MNQVLNETINKLHPIIKSFINDIGLFVKENPNLYEIIKKDIPIMYFLLTASKSKYPKLNFIENVRYEATKLMCFGSSSSSFNFFELMSTEYGHFIDYKRVESIVDKSYFYMRNSLQ